jgi:crotonobetainyl-CoA hydratase
MQQLKKKPMESAIMSSAVKTRVEDGVLEVTVDRPKANAIDAATSREMGKIFADFRDDPELRVAIVTGAGEKFFCAGWDLKAAAEGESAESDYGVGGFAGLQELPNMNKPVIAAINGIACGGGFELAISCDMILAADHATFALPEIKAGTLADAATIKLPKRIPYHIAMDLLLTGRWIDAAEAHKWGLVNEIVAADSLLDRAWEVARLLAAGPPLVFACIKETIRMTETTTIQESFNLLHESKIPTMRTLYDSEDHHEGFAAFAEKRDPVWKGR